MVQGMENFKIQAFLQFQRFLEMKNHKTPSFLQCFQWFLEMKNHKNPSFLQSFQWFLEMKSFNFPHFYHVFNGSWK